MRNTQAIEAELNKLQGIDLDALSPQDALIVSNIKVTLLWVLGFDTLENPSELVDTGIK